ncbi:MAG: diguanylate cyclase [Frankiales bacterium]|nr:diguanylate cyclase [Frankiales bacterium]
MLAVLRSWAALPTPVLCLDEDLRVVAVNPAWHRLVSAGADRWGEGAALCALLHSTALPAELHELLLAVGELDPRSPVPPVRLPESGRWLQPTLTREDGVLCLVLTDVTARESAHEALRKGVLHDPLTGLANRALLSLRSEELPASTAPAVLFLDLDHFRVINDELGHDAGDLVLRHVAEQLSAAARPGDTVARFGGDEFVVLAPGLKGEVEAVGYADRLLSALARPLQVSGREVVVTASIGLALADRQQRGADGLLRQADEAMMTAKRRGRGGHATFNHRLQAGVRQRAREIQELKDAIEGHEFVPWFQPVVELSTCQVVGFEALVRWQRPDGSIVAPGPWLELADRTTLLRRIDAQTQLLACRQATEWDEPYWLALNVSARQVHSGLAEHGLSAALTASGLDPARVTVEVTESAVMTERGVQNLGQLRELGMSLALDDFGTGHSSLSLLQSATFDKVKVDRGFTSRLLHDPRARAIVSTVVDLAAALSLDVVAEGIETEEQRDLLREMGCSHGQGFLFGRAAPTIG